MSEKVWSVERRGGDEVSEGVCVCPLMICLFVCVHIVSFHNGVTLSPSL
jgi:hypothetical protein